MSAHGGLFQICNDNVGYLIKCFNDFVSKSVAVGGVTVLIAYKFSH